jgi:hypothetical protein
MASTESPHPNPPTRAGFRAAPSSDAAERFRGIQPLSLPTPTLPTAWGGEIHLYLPARGWNQSSP